MCNSAAWEYVAALGFTNTSVNERGTDIVGHQMEDRAFISSFQQTDLLWFLRSAKRSSRLDLD